MRDINRIIIHCSATPPDMDIGAQTIKKWHLQRGWRDIGYHIVILRNGDVQLGRPIREAGAHTRGYNSDSVGVCLVGGIDKRGNAQFNFTRAQMKTLHKQICELKKDYDIKDVAGHNEFSAKACPSFDVKAWWYD